MSTSAVLILGNTTAVLVLGEDGPIISVIQGQTGPLWSLTFKNADNSAFSLTGAAYTSGYLFDRSAVLAGVGLLLTGTYATVSAALGTATFAPSAADVGTPGEYVFETLITTATLKYFFRTPVTIAERYGA